MAIPESRRGSRSSADMELASGLTDAQPIGDQQHAEGTEGQTLGCGGAPSKQLKMLTEIIGQIEAA
jgi:hypothetical protein